jgi:hypothetical protein
LLARAEKQRRPFSVVYTDVRLPMVAGRRELLIRLVRNVAGVGRAAGALGWFNRDHLVLAMAGVEWMFAEVCASRIEELAPAALAHMGTVVTGVAQAVPGEAARALIVRARDQARSATVASPPVRRVNLEGVRTHGSAAARSAF